MNEKINTIKKLIFNAMFVVAVLAGVFGLAGGVSAATYYASGYLYSTNLLSGFLRTPFLRTPGVRDNVRDINICH